MGPYSIIVCMEKLKKNRVCLKKKMDLFEYSSYLEL